MHSKIIISDLTDFFRGRNSNGKTVKQTAKKLACVSVCDVSGSTLQSCKVTRAI